MNKSALYWAERAERGIYWAVGTLLVVVAVIYVTIAVLVVIGAEWFTQAGLGIADFAGGAV